MNRKELTVGKLYILVPLSPFATEGDCSYIPMYRTQETSSQIGYLPYDTPWLFLGFNILDKGTPVQTIELNILMGEFLGSVVFLEHYISTGNISFLEALSVPAS